MNIQLTTAAAAVASSMAEYGQWLATNKREIETRGNLAVQGFGTLPKEQQTAAIESVAAPVFDAYWEAAGMDDKKAKTAAASHYNSTRSRINAAIKRLFNLSVSWPAIDRFPMEPAIIRSAGQQLDMNNKNRAEKENETAASLEAFAARQAEKADREIRSLTEEQLIEKIWKLIEVSGFEPLSVVRMLSGKLSLDQRKQLNREIVNSSKASKPSAASTASETKKAA